ncbi:MAG: AMP-binding protein, partial [Pseudomonadota bacterium]
MSNAARAWEKWYDEDAKKFDVEKSLKHQSIPAAVRAAAAEFGNAPAFSIVLPQGQSASIDFSELDEHSDAFAGYCVDVLKIQRGDVVAIQAPNCLGYLVALFGALKAGAIISNVNPLYTANETVRQLRDCGAKALVGFDLFGEELDKVVNAGVNVPIVTLSAFDFFPSWQRMTLGFAAKHIKRMIPKMTTPVTPLAEALRQGARSSAILEGREITGDETCFYQYSGGTTGQSKGVMLTARGHLINIAQFSALNPGTISVKGRTGILVLPLYHVFGLYVSLINVLFGGHTVLVPNPRPLSNLKKAFEKFPPEVFPGVNTLFAGLLAQPWFQENPPTSLELTVTGATALKESVREDWAALTGSEIIDSYGMTESTTVVATSPIGERNRPGTVGIPLPGTDMRLVDGDGKVVPVGERGEIQIKGPQVTKGYLNAAETTQNAFDNGWLRTGDVGVFDEDGYLRIVDRVKDMVIVSGFNVFPNEVENIVMGLDGVADVGVVGRPDPVSGEAVVACVVRSSETLSAEDVIAHCRDHLTAYKVPKDIRFVDQLPKTPVGKV